VGGERLPPLVRRAREVLPSHTRMRVNTPGKAPLTIRGDAAEVANDVEAAVVVTGAVHEDVI
jgi:hypothetical protein